MSKWVDVTAVVRADPGRVMLVELSHGRTLRWVKENDLYIAYAYDWPDGYLQVALFRQDRRCIGEWRDKQRIKTELLGPEVEAVEVYPAESRLVDGGTTYHLWVPPGGKLSFGFRERGRVVL